MANILRIPVDIVTDFQRRYFNAFPSIQLWHQWVKDQLKREGNITTFMGRKRWFFGRRWEAETQRAGIAYEPQSGIADYLNRGLLEVWRDRALRSLGVQLLLQVHDAIVFQYPEHVESIVVPRVQRTLELQVPLRYGRELRIPTEAFVGWNWSYAYNDKKELVNPNGLVPYTGADTRTRAAPVSLLDRRVR